MENSTKQVDWLKWDSKENCFAKYSHVPSELIYGTLQSNKSDVSIMIPTFRRADLLKEAIESALHQQTRFSFTISVVDNDSEVDLETDQLMKQYCTKYQNIFYYRNKENIGMFGNWNRCIELSQTEWLCMLHDDDMLMENYLETLYMIARSNKYGVVGSYKKILDQRENGDLHMSETGKSSFVSMLMKLFIWARQGKEIPMTLQDGGHCMVHPCVANLIHKDWALELGGFNEIFFPVADISFWEKMIKYRGVAFVPTQLYYYRIVQNESLAENTAWSVLSATPSLVKSIQKSLEVSEYQCERSRIESTIIVFNIFPELKRKFLISEVADQFGIPKKYCSSFMQRWIMLKYNIRWGLLLFRKRKHSK